MTNQRDLLTGILRDLWDGDTIDEWWATDKPNEFVLVGACGAVRITLTPEQVPAITPSEWQDKYPFKPHPFGWKGNPNQSLTIHYDKARPLVGEVSDEQETF